MQKKKNMRLENNGLAYDIIVILLCITGLCFSLYFFNKAINQSFDKLNETPIGTISFKYKSAQRKLSDRILWDRLKQDSPVYNGDIIRTAGLSEATISFIDGNVMNLYEQTLAQVFLDIDGTAVDFTEGGISLDTTTSSSGMKITAGNATVELESGSSLNATADSSNTPLSLQMNSGFASLVTDGDSGSEEIFPLTEGKSVLLTDGEETFVTPSFTVLSPSVNAKFLKQTGETLPVTFRWTTENLEQDDYITLEISKTEDFTEIAEKINVTNLNEVSINIIEGIWYWRIYSDQSANGKLQILDAPLPQTIVPANEYEYNYRTKIPAVRFMWSDDTYANSWQLEVANNPEMNNPVINQRSTQPSSIISSLEAGTWYWRVIPSYSRGIITQDTDTQASSAISLFTITQAGQLEPVKLILPRESSFVDIKNTEKGIRFSWQHDYEAEYYNITISKEANLSSPFIEQKVTDNYFVLTSETATIETGQWYWAVTQTDYEDNQSSQSEVRSFLAVDGEIIQHTIFPPDRYTLAENLVSNTRFTWKTNSPFAVNFQIASDKEFTNITLDETLNNSYISDLNLPIGTWYWRIATIIIEENSEKAYTTPPKSVISAPNLDAVTMVAPAENSNFAVPLYAPSIEYKWEEVTDAQYYQMKLYHNSDLSTPIYENLNIESTSVLIDMENMEEGTYIWTVIAMALETTFSTRRSGVLSEQTFTMRKLKPITLESPASGTIISGLNAINNPPKVRWSSVDKSINAKFILTKRNVGLSTDIELYIENPNTTIQLPPLSAGTWYWTVIAETEDNLNITALEPATLIVNRIPNLPIPGGLSPLQETVFGLNYLKLQRYVDFSWNRVRGATDYILRIKNSANKTLVEKTIDEGTSYRLEKLSILNRGKFSWTVEAVTRLENGTIIQRGNASPQTFTIDLPQLKKPDTQNTGKLYGL